MTKRMQYRATVPAPPFIRHFVADTVEDLLEQIATFTVLVADEHAKRAAERAAGAQEE